MTEQAFEEGGFVGVAVGGGTHGEDQSRGGVECDEGLAAQSGAGLRAGRLESLGGVLDSAGIHDERTQSGHRRRERVLRWDRDEFLEPLGVVGEEAFAQLDGDASEFLIEGLNREFALVVAAPVLVDAGVGDEAVAEDGHELGETEDPLVGAATVLFVPLVEVLGFEEVVEEPEGGFGNGKPGEKVVRVHAKLQAGPARYNMDDRCANT